MIISLFWDVSLLTYALYVHYIGSNFTKLSLVKFYNSTKNCINVFNGEYCRTPVKTILKMLHVMRFFLLVIILSLCNNGITTEYKTLRHFYRSNEISHCLNISLSRKNKSSMQRGTIGLWNCLNKNNITEPPGSGSRRLNTKAEEKLVAQPKNQDRF